MDKASVRVQADFVYELDDLLPDLIHCLHAARGSLVVLPDLPFDDLGV